MSAVRLRVYRTKALTSRLMSMGTWAGLPPARTPCVVVPRAVVSGAEPCPVADVPALEPARVCDPPPATITARWSDCVEKVELLGVQRDDPALDGIARVGDDIAVVADIDDRPVLGDYDVLSDGGGQPRRHVDAGAVDRIAGAGSVDDRSTVTGHATRGPARCAIGCARGPGAAAGRPGAVAFGGAGARTATASALGGASGATALVGAPVWPVVAPEGVTIVR